MDIVLNQIKMAIASAKEIISGYILIAENVELSDYEGEFDVYHRNTTFYCIDVDDDTIIKKFRLLKNPNDLTNLEKQTISEYCGGFGNVLFLISVKDMFMQGQFIQEIKDKEIEEIKDKEIEDKSTINMERELYNIIMIHVARTWERVRMRQLGHELSKDNIESVDTIQEYATEIFNTTPVQTYLTEVKKTNSVLSIVQFLPKGCSFFDVWVESIADRIICINEGVDDFTIRGFNNSALSAAMKCVVMTDSLPMGIEPLTVVEIGIVWGNDKVDLVGHEGLFDSKHFIPLDKFKNKINFK